MRSGILFITLLIVSCGNSIPVRKYQLTKAEIEYKTDTKTLEKMLAKLMTNMHNGKVATTDQGAFFSRSVLQYREEMLVIFGILSK